MYLVARDFRATGPAWTLQRLAESLDVPGTALGPVVACLERRGLIVATETEALMPARDLASIGLAEILDAVRNDSEGPRTLKGRSVEPAEAVARDVEAAIKASMNGRTLKDLVG